MDLGYNLRIGLGYNFVGRAVHRRGADYNFVVAASLHMTVDYNFVGERGHHIVLDYKNLDSSSDIGNFAHSFAVNIPVDYHFDYMIVDN